MRTAALSIAAGLVLLSGCSKGPSTEDEVRAVIASVRDAADRGDLEALEAHIADNYRDHQGSGRERVMRMVGNRTRRHRNRYIYVKVRKVEIGDDGKARVVALAGLAGGPVSEDKRPVEVTANLLRFRLVMVRSETTWQVERAAWRRASPLEML